MAHVGYVHAHLVEPVVGSAYAEGVVEVFGVLGVDGEGGHLPEVFAPCYLLGGDGRVDAFGGVLHLLRVAVGQSVLGQDGVHLHVVLTLCAQYVDHLSHDILRVLRGPLCDFHHGHLSGLASLELLLGYEDVVGEDGALGDEEGIVFLHLQHADGLVVLALEYLDDHGLLDVVLPSCHECHAHAVATLCEHGVALAHEDGVAAVVGQERVLAVGLAYKRALLHLCLEVQAVDGVAHLGQVVVPRHLLHHVDGEHLQRVGVQPQLLEYVLER